MAKNGKRIAINTRFLLPRGMEGIARFTDEVCKRLVKLRPDDSFFFFFDRNYHQQFVYADNVSPVVLKPPARHPVLFKIWFDFSVANALKKYNADLFFSPDGFGCLRTDVPQLITVHDLAYVHFPQHLPILNLWYYQHYMPKFLKKAARIHAVSSFTADDIQLHFPEAVNKIAVIHNGPDEGYHPVSIAEQKAIREKYSGGLPYFLYAGALHPRKNIENLIIAYNIFRKESKLDYKLILAGRLAWKTESIKKVLATSPYRQDIIMPGFVESTALIQLMGAAYTFIYPSIFEGFGIPVLNAMVAGVPVITSKNSAMQEVCNNAALFANPAIPEIIATAMLQLAKDRKTCESLIQRGFERAKDFSWDETAEKLSAEMDIILNK